MAALVRSSVRCWRWYTVFLKQQPLKAQALNTSLLMGTGDFIAQFFLEGKRSWREYEVFRTARFFAVGFVVFGPSMHIWYTSLDKIVKGTSTVKAATKKMLLDQSVFLPPYIVAFIALMAVFRFEKPAEIKSKVQRDFGPILVTSYQLWPAIQMINFYYVPLQHRILVMNLVGLMWNTYMAWKAEHKQTAKTKFSEDLFREKKHNLFKEAVHIDKLHLFDRYNEQYLLF